MSPIVLDQIERHVSEQVSGQEQVSEEAKGKDSSFASHVQAASDRKPRRKPKSSSVGESESRDLYKNFTSLRTRNNKNRLARVNSGANRANVRWN